MRQKTKNVRNQGSKITKWIFASVPKSPTQMGSLSVKQASEKSSHLGTFKQRPVTYYLIIAAPFAILTCVPPHTYGYSSVVFS